MEMIGNQSPGITDCPSLQDQIGQTLQKAFAVNIIPKDVSPLDASGNNVMQRTRCIYSGMSWLGGFLSGLLRFVKINI